MNNLVVIKDNAAVTDSLKVAEAFGKEHKRVLQDIRELSCSDTFRQHNFVLSSYINVQNKDMPMYYMNRKAFTLLVMGYTGPKAMEYKEAYIEKFEEMEDLIRSQVRVLSEKEQLIAAMKMTIETAQEIEVFKENFVRLEHKIDNQITLDLYEQQTLQRQINKRVKSISKEYMKYMSEKSMFMQIHRHLKAAFTVPSYKVVRRKHYQEAMKWVEAWRPIAQ